MSVLRNSVVWQLLTKDLLQYVREPAAAFFTFAFPIILLSVLGSIYGGGDMSGEVGGINIPSGIDVTYMDFFFPGYIGFILANVCLNSIPIFLAYQRETEYFRALQVSAVPLALVLAVRVVVYALVFSVSLLVVYLEARFLFDLSFHGNLLLMACGVILCFASFAAAGFLLGGIFPPQATQAIASVFFFVLYFTSGSAIPRFLFPEWLFNLTAANPLVYVVEGLTRLWLGAPFSEWWPNLLVIGIIGIMCAALTLRTFKWGSGHN